jgi:hypothetical protein
VVTGGWDFTCLVKCWFKTSSAEFALCTCGVALSKVAPYGEPETVVTINKLTSNFDFKLAEKSMGNV